MLNSQCVPDTAFTNSPLGIYCADSIEIGNYSSICLTLALGDSTNSFDSLVIPSITLPSGINSSCSNGCTLLSYNNLFCLELQVVDSFNIDDTILEAVLQKKIGPGDVVRIDLNWTHHVGEMVERAGYYKGQYNMAQWYPKMVVYDEEGWHADVFHAEGEFYGEFGDFNVKFDIPSSFIIGASGIVVDGDPGWNSVTVDTSIDFNKWVENFDSAYIAPDPSSRRNITFLAENVHDFAWVASRDFLYEKGTHNEIDVHVLYDKGRGEDWTKVVLDRSIRAIAWLEDKFGKYPYPQITTTDRVKNGGMEYPMLVMNGRASEGLIFHEYGHVYFYGILANNELDDSWLDEGFTTTQTSHYLICLLYTSPSPRD